MAAVLIGCQSINHSVITEKQTAASAPVKLRPGDVIKLTFAGAPELNQSQKIRGDGKINLPLVGEVTASGKTVPGFQAELVGLYKSQLKDSEVLVTLESGVTNVVVSGYVSKPGRQVFDRPTTVFQAIMQAGGPNQYGNLGKVRLIRTVSGRQHAETLNLKIAMSGQTTEAVYVKDGDVIYVPQKLF